MSEIIQLTDELRIRRIDRMNVTVEKLTVNDDGKRTWSQANGYGRGPFCGSEALACKWVLDHGLVDEACETDLRGAVDSYEKAADKLLKAVKKALAGAAS